jgi:ribosomal protein L11 methyltransferase
VARKSLWRLTVVSSPESQDAVAELLARLLDASPVCYNNFETGTATVSVFLQKKPSDPKAIRAEITAGLASIRRCRLDTGAAAVSFSRVKPEDWSESWKRHFQPISIGSRLRIQTSWHPKRRRLGQSIIILDPGLTFGTGHHPTTSYCLRQLVRMRRKSQTHSLLDIGTGSGILAIAAAAIGYRPVNAFDFDPVSVRAARANAEANQLSGKIRIASRDLSKLGLTSRQKFSVVCANLMADLLIAQRRRILARMAPGGFLIVAGILQHEFQMVTTACESDGLRLISAKSQKGWRSGVFAMLM